LYCEKANNYLNIKEKNLKFYFQIALIVIQRSLWTEFANMFFFLLLQVKHVFLRLAHDLVIYGCSLPYDQKNDATKLCITKGKEGHIVGWQAGRGIHGQLVLNTLFLSNWTTLQSSKN